MIEYLIKQEEVKLESVAQKHLTTTIDIYTNDYYTLGLIIRRKCIQL